MLGKQAEGSRDTAGGQGGQGIQRLPRQQKVAEQDGEGDGGGQGRQVLRQQRRQAQALEEVLDHKGGADFQRIQADAGWQGGSRHGDLASGERAHARENREGPARGQSENPWPGCGAKQTSLDKGF